MHRCLVAICAGAALLAGCDRRPDPVIGTGSGFDPITFFSGHIHSWGVVESRSGEPTETVETDCLGHLNGAGHLEMSQHLTFQDGTVQDRVWTMSRAGSGRFQATANDMIGTADGRAEGRMFHWQWVLARSPGNPLMNVTMEQWMYRLPDGTGLIRTTISKLGIILAEVTEQFTRVDDHPPATPS
jgi:hypothetical protein